MEDRTLDIPRRRRREPIIFDPSKHAYPITPAEERQYVQFREDRRGGDRSRMQCGVPGTSGYRRKVCCFQPDIRITAESYEVCVKCGHCFDDSGSFLQHELSSVCWDTMDTSANRRRGVADRRRRGSTYVHLYHLNEILATCVNIEPRIPEPHCSLIRTLWREYCRQRGFDDPIEAAAKANKYQIREAVKPLGVLARKYSERWIQIICMLLGDRDSVTPLLNRGRAFFTHTLIHEIRRRFVYFVHEFITLRSRGRFPDRRHSICNLDAVIVQILCQYFIERHGRREGLLRAKKYSWPFYPLRTPKHQTRSEARIAYILDRLQSKKCNDPIKRHGAAFAWGYQPLYCQAFEKQFIEQKKLFIGEQN